MSSSDVRAILDLPHASSSSAAAGPSRKASQQIKRPEGISREVFALMGNNAASIMPSYPSAARYKARPVPSSQKTRWEWSAFNPMPSEERPQVLHHWRKSVGGDPAPPREEYFATFNSSGPSVMQFSQMEYDQHLKDSDWTQQETSYLFALLQEYDLRFVVAADRYAYTDTSVPGATKRRTVEEIKDRYYTICRRLIRTRTALDPQAQQQLLQAYTFDKCNAADTTARETKRKQYASELFHLTAAEIAEEESLYLEVKRIEQNEKRYRADRDALLRSVMGLDSGVVNLDQANSEGVVGDIIDAGVWTQADDQNKKRKRLEEETNATPSTVSASTMPKKARESAAFDVAHCIHRSAAASESTYALGRHPAHVPAFLRSSKIPIPKQNASIRITELLSELGISAHRLVMPTRENIEIFDSLLAAAGGLIDMKRQVDRVEQEVRTLKAQLPGYIPPVAGRVSRIIAGSSRSGC
ncbi:uncharacterized protein MKK02DRAFT_26456 [Dioszegia hungarica]|uniref:SWR1-complex protein 4 n=1 Tax=Dioszegia hungarica TaxID=4972 RepID=A0AA38HDU4_9TREE|nr:uncharacterized protein MKK02DRAFT_26456 [Dioszegia hungarica]KAI9637016.1 hypothetical protein MKK02DRAFT_26456 [Dioszegia hungarica]